VRAAATGLLAALVLCDSASAAWTKPLDITPRDGYTVYVSDLAVDRRGDVAAVGETYSAPDGLVVYSSHARGPFEGEELNDSGGENAAICFDRQGGLVVLSHKIDFGGAVRVYTRPRGGSFGYERILDARPGYPYGIVTSPTGDVFAYWTATNAGNDGGGVRVAVRPAGSSRFGPVQDVSAPGLDVDRVGIVFDRQGNALMSWMATRRLEYAVRHPGGSFSAARVLSPAAGLYDASYDIASNRAGRAVAVWRAHAGRKRELRAAFGSVAGGFGGSEQIGGKANRGPYAALDRDGQAVVAWRSGGGGSFELRAAVARPAAARFGSSHVLFEGYAEQPAVAADGRGTATIAWLDGTTLRAARRRSTGGGFEREVVGESNVRAASLEVTADGRTVLAWKAFAKGGTKRIKASVAGPGDPFGAVRTLAKLARIDGVQGPGIAIGGGGGAFAWWGVDRETAKRETSWFAGSYLLP
jgi:hypothetical protein